MKKFRLTMGLAAITVIWGCHKETNLNGCNDPDALNYSPNARYNDGSCLYDNCETDFIEYFGQEYQIRNFGDMCWFVEDLKTDSALWLSSPGDWNMFQSILDTLPIFTFGDETYGENIYGNGYYYEWNVLAIYLNESLYQPKLCPTGWHIPNGDDWIKLRNYFDFEVFNPQVVEFEYEDTLEIKVAYAINIPLGDLASYIGSVNPTYITITPNYPYFLPQEVNSGYDKICVRCIKN